MMSERVLERLRNNPKVDDVFLLSGDGDHEYHVLLNPGWREWSDPYSPTRMIVERYAKDVERAVREATPFDEDRSSHPPTNTGEG